VRQAPEDRARQGLPNELHRAGHQADGRQDAQQLHRGGPLAGRALAQHTREHGLQQQHRGHVHCKPAVHRVAAHQRLRGAVGQRKQRQADEAADQQGVEVAAQQQPLVVHQPRRGAKRNRVVQPQHIGLHERRGGRGVLRRQPKHREPVVEAPFADRHRHARLLAPQAAVGVLPVQRGALQPHQRYFEEPPALAIGEPKVESQPHRLAGAAHFIEPSLSIARRRTKQRSQHRGVIRLVGQHDRASRGDVDRRLRITGRRGPSKRAQRQPYGGGKQRTTARAACERHAANRMSHGLNCQYGACPAGP
jgi:hypothetical protein